MPRILTTPLQLGGPPTRAQLANLVAADALVRRAAAEGRAASWAGTVVHGDLWSQVLVDRELARQGLDRQQVGAEEFAERVAAHEVEAREQLATGLAAIGVAAELDPDDVPPDAAVRAARTAFVRLFEAGLLQVADRVVELCTRCGTVVDPVDRELVTTTVDALTVRVPLEDAGSVDVEVRAPELLAGAVALVVPRGHAAAGAAAVMPVVGRSVPVVEDDVAVPAFAVPAHDAAAHDDALRLGLGAIAVFDESGTGTVAPVEGLARYAARATVTDLLRGEGAVVAQEEAEEIVGRCRRCGTVLLSRLGRHWFLAIAELERAAADVAREAVSFSPPSLRDDFLERAGLGSPWCLSQQGWAGEPVPVASCVDCGQLAVGVDVGESCGKCMGTLVADDAVLDPRFVAVMWPLVVAGWPGDEGAPARDAAGTALLVTRPGVERWALPMAALGLRLAGAVPFATLALQPVDDGRTPVDLEALAAWGADVARVAVLRGDFDLDQARADVEVLRNPVAGDGDPEPVVEAYDAAFASATPAAALAPLLALARDGVRPAALDRVRALALPLLGG